jgi:hypothetical protein
MTTEQRNLCLDNMEACSESFERLAKALRKRGSGVTGNDADPEASAEAMKAKHAALDEAETIVTPA